ncbi:exocyst complex subunit Sec15-like protein [Calocera viscosa TUFC12733]|uniref:Exocyst complex component SEC15 n=1 Tax=Calocera viscosa (strain TUFC12733) TaxID=1330018 RepID=A0A167KP53_CALVF|nr:exocyst complex subunit Sec15-like protein [Calocera viscosa TUFC12733]
MPPRTKRPQFTQQDIDQQLQQINLLDSSSPSENLEQLAPIIKSVHESGRQDAFLRTLSGLIESKEAEIERICGDNYQDFVSSVSTLLTVRSYTANLRGRISEMDSSVSEVGNGLVKKKKALQQAKKTANNLDEAIDTLQACLRVLDLVNRVGDMVKNGRYYTALRSLDDIQSLPPSQLSQTPFFTHLLSSLPSLRAQIKTAVTESTKSWLLEIRESSGLVGSLGLEAVEQRSRRWRGRREKEGVGRSKGVGSAAEGAVNERIDFDPVNNDQITVDFKPLYQCILIHTAMGQLEEMQTTYQEDRKTQAALILAQRLSSSSQLTKTLPDLLNELLGFFIIEAHVMRTTASSSFRSHKDVEELFDSVIPRVCEAVERGIRDERDQDILQGCRALVGNWAQALEGYGYDTTQIHTLLFKLFERYVTIIQDKYKQAFEDIVMQDDLQPMMIDNDEEVARVLGICWLDAEELQELSQQDLPIAMPFSRFFPLCCVDFQTFIDKFYSFLEGGLDNRRDVDDLLRKSLEVFLEHSIARKSAERLSRLNQPSQVAQVIVNIERLFNGTRELEKQLASMRARSGGSSLRLNPVALQGLLNQAFDRLRSLIRSKLDDFFDLAEYNWIPAQPEKNPSMFLYELVNWLFTVVDSLGASEELRERLYDDAMDYIGNYFMGFLVGPNVKALNDLAIANLLVDVDFLEGEFGKRGRPGMELRFGVFRTLSSIILQNATQTYMQPTSRRPPQGPYANVQPKMLYELLNKLARGGAQSRVAAERERAERRRREAVQVSQLLG